MSIKLQATSFANQAYVRVDDVVFGRLRPGTRLRLDHSTCPLWCKREHS